MSSSAGTAGSAIIATVKILLVEDEIKLAEYLRRGLGEEGFVVDVARNGIDGLHMALEAPYALVILDRMLPGLDGLGLLAALRRSSETPVLMLTARGSVEDKVEGLRSGADDYLTKPFAFSELVARINVILRRTQRASGVDTGSALKLADLRVDLLRRKVSRGGQPLDLTRKEFNLLVLLLRRQGEVLSRTELAEQVWEMSFNSMTNVVDVAIRRLRAKLDAPFGTPLLHTVRGVGYVLDHRG